MQNANIGFNVTYEGSGSFSDAMSDLVALEKGFKYPIENMDLTKEDYEKFMNILKDKYTMTEYDFSDTSKTMYKQFHCDNFIMYVNGGTKDVYVSCTCDNIDTVQFIFNTFKKFLVEDTETKVFMTNYFEHNGSWNNSINMINKEDIFAISDKYYPYIKTDVMYRQFFTSQESILLITGEPGLGKSKMANSILKFAANNPEVLPYDKFENNPDMESQYVTVAYIKSTNILSDDSLWRELAGNNFDFVILDDLDFFLTSRSDEVQTGEDQQKNSFLSHFLSFTDGIESNKTKFIITTNQPYDHLDTALLRKGRLFDILELRELTKDEAFEIWNDNELSDKEFQDVFGTYHEVLPAELGSEIAKRKNKRIDDALESYLLEDGISKVKKAGKSKKAGF